MIDRLTTGAGVGRGAPTVWSIGHSTQPFERFVALLVEHEIAQVVDIRRVPRSRRYPHFDGDALSRALPERAVAYVHLSRLGGWRRARADSPNGAWRNRSFRGYADYAMSEEFAVGLAQLCEVAAARRTVVMCSEALWWRCHRRLVADRLLVAGDTVGHIASGGQVAVHRLTAFAKLGPGALITYPAGVWEPVG
jgi:uncharacterized protein (DUF488 family)